MAVSRKLALASAALVLAIASAAFGTRDVRHTDETSAREAAPRGVDPFALAELLAEAPPDVVVIAFDGARHPLRGAQPAASFGATDDAFVANAPRARRIVLASIDVVQEDRLARRLAATGRDVAVLDTGITGWDRAMDADPAAPEGTAPEAAWRAYRMRLALRRSFGDAAPAVTTPVASPIAPAAIGGGGAKKREGC